MYTRVTARLFLRHAFYRTNFNPFSSHKTCLRISQYSFAWRSQTSPACPPYDSSIEMQTAQSVYWLATALKTQGSILGREKGHYLLRNFQTGSEAYPAFQSVPDVHSPVGGWKNSRSMILTTHHYLLSRVRTSGATLLLPLYVHGVYRNNSASPRKIYVRVTPNTRRVPNYPKATVPNTDRSDECTVIRLIILQN